jgi:hypothetical protein
LSSGYIKKWERKRHHRSITFEGAYLFYEIFMGAFIGKNSITIAAGLGFHKGLN